MSARIKKGDTVIVTTGKSKNHKGEVLFVDKKRNKVLVSGANLFIRHTKPSAQNPEGGKISREFPVHVSNVAIADPKTGAPTRVGFKIVEGGKKVRYAKKSGERIE